jgi:Fe-Mn family superoxide dismutase
MRYEAKDYGRLMGMDGFSDDSLENHFALYRGYVAHTNEALEVLSEMAANGQESHYEYGEVKRRLGWEWNGMRLHELYFDNLGAGESLEPDDGLSRLIVRSFGSRQAWERDFKAVGSMRGVGWAILYHDRPADRLLNVWIDEHDSGHLVGVAPLLVMDVFEHAFLIDYGLKRGEYIDAFFRNIRWEDVGGRLADSYGRNVVEAAGIRPETGRG